MLSLSIKRVPRGPKTPALGNGRRQRGFLLIEALVAILLLSIGILGLAAMQVRILANTSGATYGDVATRLATDISERMQANGFAAGRTPSSFYADFAPWGPAAAAPDCDSATCNVWQQAQSDISKWKTDIVNSLPDGNSTIKDNGSTLRVLITWKDNATSVRPLGQDSGCEDNATLDNKRSCLRLIVPKPEQS